MGYSLRAALVLLDGGFILVRALALYARSGSACVQLAAIINLSADLGYSFVATLVPHSLINYILAHGRTVGSSDTGCAFLIDPVTPSAYKRGCSLLRVGLLCRWSFVRSSGPSVWATVYASTPSY